MGRPGRRSKQTIRFSNRTHPRSGIVSLIMGASAIFLLIALCIVSSTDKGASGPWIGIAGIWTLFLSGVGFFLATRSYRMEDIYRITPMLGSIFNGAVMLALLLLYVSSAV